MGLFDIFRQKTPDAQPRIRNARDLKAFLLGATHDERLAQFLAEVAEKVGRDGYLDIERGGAGKPYAAEYKWREDDSRKSSEIQAEYQSLRERLASAPSESERDQLERQLAELAGGVCTIRINVPSADEFERLRSLIAVTWKRLKEIARNR